MVSYRTCGAPYVHAGGVALSQQEALYVYLHVSVKPEYTSRVPHAILRMVRADSRCRGAVHGGGKAAQPGGHADRRGLPGHGDHRQGKKVVVPLLLLLNVCQSVS